MGRIILKIIPVIIFWGIFIFVILQIPYPDSLTQANLSQSLFFFLSLFLAVTATANIFLKNLLISSLISLGVAALLILKALEALNIVTTVLIVAAIALLISYFKKNKKRIREIRRIWGIIHIRKK